MEPKTQETLKITWEAPAFERTALTDATFHIGQYNDGDGWDSERSPSQ